VKIFFGRERFKLSEAEESRACSDVRTRLGAVFVAIDTRRAVYYLAISIF
jgi:hypothetical protein